MIKKLKFSIPVFALAAFLSFSLSAQEEEAAPGFGGGSGVAGKCSTTGPLDATCRGVDEVPRCGFEKEGQTKTCNYYNSL